MSLVVAALVMATKPAFDVQALLNQTVTKFNLPAVGCCVVSLTGEPKVWVAGVRRVGSQNKANTSDTWHLGSDTKAFTAAVMASVLAGSKVTYQTTVKELFGLTDVDASHADTTLADLLDMQGKLNHDPAKGWWVYQGMNKSAVEERQAVAEDVFKVAATEPLTGSFHYSNTSYVMIGHAAERITHQTAETLIAEHIFRPLHMMSAAFGPNPPGQPWPHINDVPMKQAGLDNPAVMTPAGRVRCSLHDWALFIREVMLSVRGDSSKLAAGYGSRIKAAPSDDHYVNGWIKTTRGWSQGPVLTHSGSNTMNFCTAWVAPTEGIAYLTVTNDGGANAAPALDGVTAALITNKVN